MEGDPLKIKTQRAEVKSIDLPEERKIATASSSRAGSLAWSEFPTARKPVAKVTPITVKKPTAPVKKAEASTPPAPLPFNERVMYYNPINTIAARKGKQALSDYDLLYAERMKTCETPECATFVSQIYDRSIGDTRQTGVYGDAWWMPAIIKKAGGEEIYNVWDASFNDVTDPMKFSYQAMEKIHASNPTPDMFQVGDIVGIYNPTSVNTRKVLQSGSPYKNSHIGIVTSIKNGVPYITSNYYGDLKTVPYNDALVSSISRPRHVASITEITPKREDVFSATTSNQTVNTYISTLNDFVGPMIEDMGSSVDKEWLVKASIGITKPESGFLRDYPKKNEFIEDNIKRYVYDVDSIESMAKGLTNYKLANLNSDERKYLGVRNVDDLYDPRKAAKAVMYTLLRHYEYLKKYSETYPEIGLKEEDLRNLAILGYNQGMAGISTVGMNKERTELDPEELAKYRSLYTGTIRDINSTKLKYFKDFGLEGVGEAIYDRRYGEYPTYISRVNQAIENLPEMLNFKGGGVIKAAGGVKIKMEELTNPAPQLTFNAKTNQFEGYKTEPPVTMQERPVQKSTAEDFIDDKFLRLTERDARKSHEQNFDTASSFLNLYYPEKNFNNIKFRYDSKHDVAGQYIPNERNPNRRSKIIINPYMSETSSYLGIEPVMAHELTHHVQSSNDPDMWDPVMYGDTALAGYLRDKMITETDLSWPAEIEDGLFSFPQALTSPLEYEASTIDYLNKLGIRPGDPMPTELNRGALSYGGVWDSFTNDQVLKYMNDYRTGIGKNPNRVSNINKMTPFKAKSVSYPVSMKDGGVIDGDTIHEVERSFINKIEYDSASNEYRAYPMEGKYDDVEYYVIDYPEESRQTRSDLYAGIPRFKARVPETKQNQTIMRSPSLGRMQTKSFQSPEPGISKAFISSPVTIPTSNSAIYFHYSPGGKNNYVNWGDNTGIHNLSNEEADELYGNFQKSGIQKELGKTNQSNYAGNKIPKMNDGGVIEPDDPPGSAQYIESQPATQDQTYRPQQDYSYMFAQKPKPVEQPAEIYATPSRTVGQRAENRDAYILGNAKMNDPLQQAFGVRDESGKLLNEGEIEVYDPRTKGVTDAAMLNAIGIMTAPFDIAGMFKFPSSVGRTAFNTVGAEATNQISLKGVGTKIADFLRRPLFKKAPETMGPFDNRVYNAVQKELNIQLSPENMNRAIAYDAANGTHYYDELKRMEREVKSGNSIYGLQVHVLDEPFKANKNALGISTLNTMDPVTMMRASAKPIQTTDQIPAHFKAVFNTVDEYNNFMSIHSPDFRIVLPKRSSAWSDEILDSVISHEIRHNLDVGGMNIPSWEAKKLQEIMMTKEELMATKPYRDNIITRWMNRKELKDLEYRRKPSEINAYLVTNFRRDLNKAGATNTLGSEVTWSSYEKYVNYMKSNPQARRFSNGSLRYVKDMDKLFDVMNKSLLTGVGASVGAKSIENGADKSVSQGTNQ